MDKIFKPLSFVLNNLNPTDVFCRRNSVEVNAEMFLSDISRLYRNISAEPLRSKYLIYCKSSYQFAVALFSVWQRGSVCVLPPNNNKEVISKFNNYVNAIITDQPDCDTELNIISPIQGGEDSHIKLVNMPENEICLELFTSGTTGERKCVKKTIANLNLELLDLFDTYGSLLNGTMTFSTVSHQHIYGLLHKVLLPVCTGRVFVDETYFYPEKLVMDMNNEEKNNVLISSPAHLKILPELVNLNDISSFCKAIFSSGSLLDTEDSLKLSSLSGIKPIEVLGSTETGGVAWRSQSESLDSKNWSPFKSVKIRKTQDGFLQVKSPFIFMENADDEWFTMGDIIDLFNDNSFRLCGRGDRIAKIGEKRVSLEEMEKILKVDQSVIFCKIFPITRKHNNMERTVLACVIEIRTSLLKEDQKNFINKLKSRLLKYFAQILIPKYWRFVQKMPVDPQGKTSIEELKKLFNKRTGNV